MGYIGSKRSENSLNAIEDFEIPLSMLNKSKIEEFKDSLEDYGVDDIDIKVFSLNVSIWKYAAGIVGASSWHHTGKFYNQTNHYSLYKIANYLTENIEDIKDFYSVFLKKQNEDNLKENEKIEVGYIEYAIWGGTCSHPKIVGYDSTLGYVDRKGKTDWLVSIDGKKHDIYSNKVKTLIVSDDLKEFKKKVPEKIDLRTFKKFLRNKGLK